MKVKFNKLEIRSRKAQLISDAPHSGDVHFGRDREDGTRTPARPFMDAAVAETDPLEDFVTVARETGDLNMAFDLMAENLHEAVKEQIMSEKWAWDRTTIRSDGSVVESPRDIVDTGELLNSQRLVFDYDM